MLNRTTVIFAGMLVLSAAVASFADEESLRKELSRMVKTRPDEVDAIRIKLGKQVVADGDRQLMLKLLKDSSADIRFGAAELMGEFSEQSTAEQKQLLELMGDEKFSSRGYPVWFAASVAIGACRPFPLESIRDQMSSENWIRRRAGLIAAHRAGRESAPLLSDAVKLFKDEKLDIVRASLGYLQALGEDASPALDDIVAMLKHEDFHTQYWAARALGSMGQKGAPAAKPLVERLENGVASVRRNAATALGQIGPEAGEDAARALVEALGDSRVTVVEEAATALAAYEPYAELASEPLKKKLEYPAAEVKLAVARSLAKLGLHLDDCLYQLTKVLKGRDYPWVAAEILGGMGDKAKPAIPELVKVLGTAIDPETRVACAKALVTLKAKAAVPTLEEVSQSEDQDEWVREVAKESLKALQGDAEK